jgi:hypothetical protein
MKYYHTNRSRIKLAPPTKFQEVEMLIKSGQPKVEEILKKEPASTKTH